MRIAKQAPEPVVVTIKPTKGGEAGVFELTVRVDNLTAGSSVVRSSPREFAFQKEEPTPG
jgi:hypothetical protein